jgi:sugar-specific transcriptional regulator TrmB
MNNAFSKAKILVLDENHLIKPDNSNGVILVKTTERFDDEKLETVTTKQEFYYPRIAQALRKYVDLEMLVDDDIEALTEKIDAVYALIDSIDRTFKQF